MTTEPTPEEEHAQQLVAEAQQRADTQDRVSSEAYDEAQEILDTATPDPVPPEGDEPEATEQPA